MSLPTEPLPSLGHRRENQTMLRKLCSPLTRPFQEIQGGPLLDNCVHRHVDCGPVEIEFFLPEPFFGTNAEFQQEPNLDNPALFCHNSGPSRTNHDAIEIGVTNWNYSRPKFDPTRFIPGPQEPYVTVTATWKIERVKGGISLERDNPALIEKYLREDYHAHLESKPGVNWKIRNDSQREMGAQGRGWPQKSIERHINAQLLSQPDEYQNLVINNIQWIRYIWAPKFPNKPNNLHYSCVLLPNTLLTVSYALTVMVPDSTKYWWSPLVEDSEALMQGTKLHFKELPKKQG